MRAEHLSLNADLARLCNGHSPLSGWLDSPAPGVSHRLLRTDNSEVVRATPVLRYAQGSALAAHTRNASERALVLDGPLRDKHAVYVPCNCIEKPVDILQSQYSPKGCLLSEKLRSLDARDDELVVIDTRPSERRHGLVESLKTLPMGKFKAQDTALMRWLSQTFFNLRRHCGGKEIDVLQGVFLGVQGDYPAGSCLRSQHMSQQQAFYRKGGLTLASTGHLV